MIKITRTKTRDDYMELIQTLPLKAIRTDADLARANAVLARLMVRIPEDSRTPGQRDYIDALFILVREAEQKIRERLTKDISPLEVLKHLMEESGVSGKKLGEIIGSQPNVSMILSGKRQLSKANIHKLAEHFKLSPAVFMQ